jgi:hypothetical protein
MRIARVLGAMVTAREVEPCNPPARLMHPADTPLSDHYYVAVQPLPIAPGPIAPGRGAPAQGQCSVVIVTRTVRRYRVR